MRDFTQSRWLKLTIKVKEGKHDKGSEIDKLTNDKERVLAAQENDHVMAVINRLIEEPDLH